MTATRRPAFELRIGARAVDYSVVARTRLCWSAVPSAADVLDALATRALDAHRRGRVLCVESPPASVAALLLATGLCAPDGPIVLG